jgi:hypothetical protein
VLTSTIRWGPSTTTDSKPPSTGSRRYCDERHETKAQDNLPDDGRGSP